MSKLEKWKKIISIIGIITQTIGYFLNSQTLIIAGLIISIIGIILMFMLK